MLRRPGRSSDLRDVSEFGRLAELARDLNNHFCDQYYCGRLSQLAAAAIFRNDIQLAYISVDETRHRLVLAYALGPKSRKAYPHSLPTVPVHHYPLPASIQESTTKDMAIQRINMLLRPWPNPDRKRYRTYIQHPSWRTAGSVIALALLTLYLELVPRDAQLWPLSALSNLVGDQVLYVSYMLLVSLHTLEAIITLAICHHREYDGRTTLCWTLQTLAIGMFGMRYLIWPRPWWHNV
jgi:hypothetical protein